MNKTNCSQGKKISNYELSFEAVREKAMGSNDMIWDIITSYMLNNNGAVLKK
jgi:hypothetical protein